MAYSVVSKKSGKTFYLHGRETTLRGGHKRTLFFFSGEIKDGAMDQLPEGYDVTESPNGLPLLVKKKA